MNKSNLYQPLSFYFSLFPLLSPYIKLYIYEYNFEGIKSEKNKVRVRFIGQVVRVFASSPRDMVSIPGSVIPKTLKMVLDASLLNIQQHKVHIAGKVEQYREKSNALPYTSVR